ncbi:N-acetylmuramidase family protein [Mucilaginibacter sp.]|uniref:N-acetylmuramidase family protein n=1 Tax=Mucilaginibacter sp. TaxID=1882438 RepID=UPI0035BBF28F
MITEKDIAAAAKALGCNVAVIRAITLVESNGHGFYGSGKIVLKFEGHVFHRYTKGKFDKSHPSLSYPEWTEKYSEFGEKAYNRFNQAFELDPIAAMLSTSWGMFQIMGENYIECGYRSIHEFITAMKLGDSNQLMAFVKYCLYRKLDRFMKNFYDMADNFAYRYNGALWKRNDYGGKLRRAYNYFKTLYKIS